MLFRRRSLIFVSTAVTAVALGLATGNAAVFSDDSSNANYLMGRLGLGTNAPAASLDIVATGSTSAIIVPRDTTGNRPAATNGMIRYNTTTNGMEGYVNGAWVQFAVQAPGSTANVTAVGPPASANVYSYSGGVTATYSPSYGSIANTYDRNWPTNGAANYRNSSCVPLTAGANYITYDLGSIKTIGNVYSTIGQAFQVGLTFSTDNVNYTSGLSLYQTTASLQYLTVALSPNVTARYIRAANSNNTNDNYSALCELAVGP